MLGAGRYLLGVAEVGLLVGFATLGAARVRSRLLPRFSGPPAWLATAVIALAILIWVAELLGTFGAFKAVPYLLCVVVVGLGMWALGLRVRGAVCSPALPRPDGFGEALALPLRTWAGHRPRSPPAEALMSPP